MFALIFESLGATELLFILAIALIFFGPRKLPQLARTMGKGLAEFRKASDDFKRTWEREVALETVPADNNSMLEMEQAAASGANVYGEPPVKTSEPEFGSPDPEEVVPRESKVQASSDAPPEVQDIPTEPGQPEPVRKQDWL